MVNPAPQSSQVNLWLASCERLHGPAPNQSIPLPCRVAGYWCIDVCDRSRADLRKDVCLEAGKKPSLVTGGEPVSLRFEPLSGHGLKRVLGREPGGALVRLLRRARVAVPSQQCPSASSRRVRALDSVTLG